MRPPKVQRIQSSTWELLGLTRVSFRTMKRMDSRHSLALSCRTEKLKIIRVASWKGIPYAQPPVENLRFMPPEDLETQDDTVVDTTTDALRCVQFSGAKYGVINSNIVGARSGPGQEDCLKLWIWKPANASSDGSLPVMFYIHVRHFGEDPGTRRLTLGDREAAYSIAQHRITILATGSVKVRTSSPSTWPTVSER